MNMQPTIRAKLESVPTVGAALDSPGSFGANPLYIVGIVPDESATFTLIGGPAHNVGAWLEVEPEDRAFIHPEHGEREFSRGEALAIAAPPPRCSRTFELPLAA